MFPAQQHRKKRRKDHRYFSIVETIAPLRTNGAANRSLSRRDQRSNNKRHGARRCRCVDEQQQEYENLSLFPDDAKFPPMWSTAYK